MWVWGERELLTGCRGRAAAAAGRVGWTRAQRFPWSRSCNSCKKERNTRKCFLVKYIQRWKKKTQSATVTFNEQTVVFIDNYIYIYKNSYTLCPSVLSSSDHWTVPVSPGTHVSNLQSLFWFSVRSNAHSRTMAPPYFQSYSFFPKLMLTVFCVCVVLPTVIEL